MEILIVNADYLDWVAGDIIAVRADGERWGRQEHIEEWTQAGGRAADFPNPHLSILVFSGVPPDINLAEPQLEVDQDDPDRSIVVRKRAWKFDLTKLNARQAGLIAGGSRSVLPQLLVSYITRKSDGEVCPQDWDRKQAQEPFRADATCVLRDPASPLQEEVEPSRKQRRKSSEGQEDPVRRLRKR